MSSETEENLDKGNNLDSLEQIVSVQSVDIKADIVSKVKNALVRELEVLKNSDWREEILDYLYQQQIVVVLAIIVLLMIFGLVLLALGKLKFKVDEVKKFVGVGSAGPHFRKRDKVLFYGRKMLRKVRSLKSGPRGSKRKLMLKLAKKILQLKSPTGPVQLTVTEPSAEYLEETSRSSNEHVLPPEFLYMLKSVRVFGHFEKPLFLELCKHVETIQIKADDYLFKLGDPDDKIYVVQQGQVNMYVRNNDETVLLKEVLPGENIISLLSFTDVLTGLIYPYRTISAQAAEDSTILSLSVLAFKDVCRQFPEITVRIVQIIMYRLHRVTFCALHQYLGLSSELLNSANANDRIPLNYTDGVGDPYEVHSTVGDKQELKDATAAEEGFARHLGLKSTNLVKGKVEIRNYSPGVTLVKQNQIKDLGLYFVMSGTVVVSQKAEDDEEEKFLFTVENREVVGNLSVLSGEPSFFTIRAKTDSRVGFLNKEFFYSIIAQHPEVVLHAASGIIVRLSPFVRQIDFALDWVYIEAGRALYRQDNPSDCTYVVLSGRLRSVVAYPDGKRELVGEYGRGDLVGIVEVLTHTPRSTTVMAVRDTELAKISEGLLNLIKLKYPIVVTKLIQLLGYRILGTYKQGRQEKLPPIDLRPSQNNLSTVALLAVNEDVPLEAFSFELLHALNKIGPCLFLNSDIIRKTLGKHITDAANEYRLTSWLGQQEDHHKMVLYMCDSTFTPWTQRCIRHADCILIVALAEQEPSVGKIEKQLDNLAVRTQKELVLLHRDVARKPNHTAQWLNMRSWCSFHYHIRCPPRVFSKRSRPKLSELYEKVFLTEPNIHSDFSRLARFLTGSAVGLVLGGGGARGAAHVGMIKAILEANIPIDIVGGVSIGAFIGALYCMETDITNVTQKAREWSKMMSQYWRQAWDLTYPVTSWFTGAEFNKSLQKTLGEASIEDLWLPYFTVTTDITDSAMRVHTHGSVWRYTRASMSLSGFMPPLCDPKDGHLLLDGGYVNNLPADVIRAMGAQTIMAIDVGSQDESDVTNYGDSLSGWWLLWKRWNPFTDSVKIPSLPDIQSRLAYVSCVRQLEGVKNSNYCEYIRPPIDRYKTLQFSAFDEIKDIGYNHGKTFFRGMMKTGYLAQFIKHPGDSRSSSRPSSQTSKTSPSISAQKNNFIDLAQIVCKIHRPETQKSFEDEADYTNNTHRDSTPVVNEELNDSTESIENSVKTAIIGTPKGARKRVKAKVDKMEEINT